jgi:hypothetical protein
MLPDSGPLAGTWAGAVSEKKGGDAAVGLPFGRRPYIINGEWEHQSPSLYHFVVFIRNPLPSDTVGGSVPAAAALPIRISPYYLHKKRIFSGKTETS